jgi:hypothetical protein
MRNYFLSFFCFTLWFSANGQQVPLQSVVEHFTNTRCSICASRNPGFYTNLAAHPSMMHLSIHPSSPYATCILSQQNTATNNARTNYYGIFGGTPRLVINGNVVPASSDYASSNLFSPYLSGTSSFQINVDLIKISNDSLEYTVVIEKMDTSSLSQAILFSGNLEDTVFVNGGNGEQQHYNVLRYGSQEQVVLPSQVGDVVTLTKRVGIKNFWDLERMKAFAILQSTSNKRLIQSGKSSLLDNVTASVDNQYNAGQAVFLYPNPASTYISIKDDHYDEYMIYSMLGEVVQRGTITATIDVSAIPGGNYILLVQNQERTVRNTTILKLNK